MPQIRANVINDLALGIVPDVAFVPVGSPNGVVLPLTAVQITGGNSTTGMRNELATMQYTAKSYGVPLIPWTWLSTNSSVKEYNASDSVRHTYNDSIRAMVGAGFTIADFDAALADITDGDGQVNILAGATSDNIHPNDTGNALMAVIAKVAVGRGSLAPVGKIRLRALRHGLNLPMLRCGNIGG